MPTTSGMDSVAEPSETLPHEFIRQQKNTVSAAMDQKAPPLQNGLRFSGFGGSMAAGSAGFDASPDWSMFLKPSRSLARKLTENGFGAFGSYRLSPSVVRRPDPDGRSP